MSTTLKLAPNNVNQLVQIQHHIREMRELLGMTQTELGQRIGVGKSAISRFESFSRPMSMKYALLLHIVIQNDLKNGTVFIWNAAKLESLYVTSGLKEFVETI
jgi:transcriptional regulator with XRE-family HTH domain